MGLTRQSCTAAQAQGDQEGQMALHTLLAVAVTVSVLAMARVCLRQEYI